MKSESGSKRVWLKVAVASLLILCAGGYSAKSWMTYSRGIQGERPFGREGRDGPPGGGPPPPGEQSVRLDRPTGRAEGWRGPGEGDREGPPSPEERRQRFKQMSSELGITPEQQQQLEQLHQQGGPRGPEGHEARMAKMQEILTPQQMEGLRTRMHAQMQSGMQNRMARRIEHAKRKLPADQVRLLEQRMQERRKQMQGRRPPPGVPPPDGPPPR